MIIFLGDKKLGDNGVGDNGLGDSWLGDNGNRPLVPLHIHENWESKLTVEELIQEELKHIEGFKLWRSKILNELNCPSNKVEKKRSKGMSTATLKILF